MSTVISPSSPTVDLAAVKARQQAAWSAGNYAVVGTTLQIVGESLCEALDLRPGARVLDVAAGNGNATQQPAIDRGDNGRKRRDHHCHMAADKVALRRSGPAVGHVR